MLDSYSPYGAAKLRNEMLDTMASSKPGVCIKSQDDDSMMMCMSKSQDDDIMMMCL